MIGFNRSNQFLDFWKLPHRSVVFNKDFSTAEYGAIRISMPCESISNPEFFNWDSVHMYAPIIDSKAMKNMEVSDLIQTNTKDQEICLPFNLNLAVYNLLTEQYLKSESDQRIISIARSIYYNMKPLLPRTIQLALRKRATTHMNNRSFPAWPVDTSVEGLHWSLLRLVLALVPEHNLPIISLWPSGARSCLVITHDVELQTGFDQISSILSIEQKYGVHSAWNFIPERYKVDRTLLKKLQNEGFEVGVHGLKHNGRLFGSYQAFTRGAERINFYLQEWGSVGFRSESNLRNLDWMSEQLQLEYDTSCLSAELYGAQPGGSCTVFPFLHGNLVELPITLQQDFTLLDILLLSPEEALENWQQTIKIIKSYNGMVLINIHPDYMKTPLRLRLYGYLLEILTNDSSSWNALPCEVARWWKDRHSSNLTVERGRWTIDGKARDQGTVMKVTLQNSKSPSLSIKPFYSE
jgi:hypothetical protein